MKAFGIRLAAGAVTILLGAVMAAQGSKDLENGTETAWNAESESAGRVASPIGVAGDLDGLEPWTPPGAADDDSLQVSSWNEDSSDGGGEVQLVQHVEPSADPPAASFALPDGGETAATAAADGPQLTMGLPTFSDVSGDAGVNPAAESGVDAAAGFNPGMNIPADMSADLRSDPAESAMSTYPETSAESFTIPPAATHGQQDSAPSNDLRGGAIAAAPMIPEDAVPETQFEDPSDASVNTQAAPFTSPVAMLGAVTMPGQTDPQPPAATSKTQMTLQRNTEPSVRLAEIPSAANVPPAEMAVDSGYAGQDYAGMPYESAGATAKPEGIPGGIQNMPPVAPAEMVSDGYGQPAMGTQETAPQGYNPAEMARAEMAQAEMAQAEMAQYTQPQQNNAPSMPYGGDPAYSNAAPAPYGNPTQYNEVQAPQLPPPARTPVPARMASMQSNAATAGGSRTGDYSQPPAASDLSPNGPTMASPGERVLDGVQQPSVVIHKRAPQEVKVGKPASFVIHVKNVGNATALDVRVQDRVPAGMRLQDATPRPDPQYQPELFWVLGDLQAGEERTITLQLVPEQEGELGSVARVTFEAAASVRTVSTRPELKIVQRAPKQVLIGQQVEIELEISNPGSGDATNVVLQENVPPGFSHPAGRELDNVIGTLRPNDVRRQVLRMRAVEPGIVQNTITVKGDDGLENTHTVAVEIISPELQVALTGPSRRYLERQATFLMNVANVGTADATNVEIAVQLDRGFTFVETEYEGQYDPTRHAVFWSLPNLPKGDSGQVKLTLLPVKEGERVLQVEASADLGIKASNQSQVAVDSLAELTFAISDAADPIEIGGETTYEIKVNNSGSKDDSNVRVQMLLPPGLQLVGNGDFQSDGRGTVAFTPKAVLQANGEFVYRIKARGVAAGRHIIKAVVTSDQSKIAVTKEESTMVYADQ